MSDRRLATTRPWPWERSTEHLEEMEHAELRMLRWIIDAQVVIGGLVSDVHRDVAALKSRLENLSMTLAADIQAAADATGAAAQAAADRVIATLNANNSVVLDLQAHNAADDAAIALLQSQIDAGTVTPEAAQAILDKLTETQTALATIDAAPVETA